MARRKTKDIHLKYSLLSEDFTSAIGKRRTQNLREAISNWTADKNDETAEQLIGAYVDSLVTYWKKTDLADIDSGQVKDGYELTVDLVYKKGRKPNTVRLENNPDLKKELRRLAA
jgi:hypothetical protein